MTLNSRDSVAYKEQELEHAHPTLHHNTRNHQPRTRKRLVLDYVDPYGGSGVGRRYSPVVKSDKQTLLYPAQGHRSSLTHGPQALSGENGSNKELWEGLSLTQAHFDPWPSNVHRRAESTPKERRQGVREPLQTIKRMSPSPLPPSSLPGSSSQEDLVELLDVEAGRDDTDPFGFFAAEERLKARKPDLPLQMPESPRFMKNYSQSEAGSSVKEAFATQVGRTTRHEGQPFASLGKRATPSSPFAPSARANSEHSSPCQQRVRRKVENQEDKGKHRPRRRKLDDTATNDPKTATLALEARLPKRSKKRTTTQDRAGRTCKAVEGQKGMWRKHRVKQGGQKAEASDIDEAREKVEREREERLKYYKKLDTYQLVQERVWVV